ncbi:MAG: 30S ribosomal protein S1, partial [Christensenellales bacterium]
AAELPYMEKACLVAQTTASKKLWLDVLDEIKGKCGELAAFDTICSTTAVRQEEAAQIAKRADAVLVVGGSGSSNTRELANICSTYCKNTFLIQQAEQINLENALIDGIIGIVAGASTPELIIREVIAKMSELEKSMAINAENDAERDNGRGNAEDGTAAEAVVTAEEASVPAEQSAEETPVEQAEDKGQENESGDAAEQGSDEAAAVSEEPQGEKSEEKDADEAQQSEDSSFLADLEKSLVKIRNGQVITGKVVQISGDEVSVNIGYKSDGYIPKNEFSSDPNVVPAEAVSIGDEIEVEVLKVNDGEGNVLLSHKRVEERKYWDQLLDEIEKGSEIEGLCKEVVKGGVVCSIKGIRAFVPASQVSTKYVEDLSQFVGQTLRLRVIEVDKAKRRVVASQKAILLEDIAKRKKELWSSFEAGQQVVGTVRRITDFGAFVDIGGIDGLVHVTDLAWSRVRHPSDIVKINEKIDVLILSVDTEKERISLGYKQLKPKPWELAPQKYIPGSTIEGKVVRIVPFGAFIELEPGIDGLVHISQVATHRIEKVEDELKIGEIIAVKVLDIDPEAKRISLSRREVLADQMYEQREEQPQREQNFNAGNRAPEPRRDNYDRGNRYDNDNYDGGNVNLPPIQETKVTLGDFFPKDMKFDD